MRTIDSKQRQEMGRTERPRAVSDAVRSLDEIATRSVNLLRKPLPPFEIDGRSYSIPRYLFLGPKGGAEPIRIGIFTGANGDEPEGPAAVREFTERLELAPEVAKDYCLFIYPILNPSGYEARTRETASGVTLASQIWRNSHLPEVQQIQSELWMHGFDGLIYLKTDPAGSEIGIAVGGPIFARHLLGSSLETAQDVLPQAVDASINALPRFRASQLEAPNDLIRAAPGLRPQPFEVVVTIPGQQPAYLQRAAVALILQKALLEYRHFISFGANI